jgi:FtsP/CotA-like multicopper oxidase with cupredoxin domain
MSMMNWLSSAEHIHWILRDPDTGKENMDIGWEFEKGEVIKIRIFNDPDTIHPMNHPIHLHGQRYLVLSIDGIPNQNLVWKDTAIVPVGATMDILVDMSNPGDWMLHCHIAEHLHSGMMTAFTVNETR